MVSFPVSKEILQEAGSELLPDTLPATNKDFSGI